MKDRFTFLFFNSIITIVFASCILEKPDSLEYSVNSIVFNDSLENCGCDYSLHMCVRKCCAENYTLQNRTCVLNYEPFSVSIYQDDTESTSLSTYSLITGIMKCAGKYGYYKLDPKEYTEDKFYFQENGKLWLEKINKFVYKDQFCLENFDDIGLSALVCFPKGARLGRGLNALGMIISMPFLLTTFIVYALLPDRNLHGNAMMCYVVTLFGAYTILVSIQLHTSHISDATCKTLGILCLFFFMVSFFWINVMSIDIWWTFSGLRGFSGTKKETERKRLLLYSSYAFGTPLLHVILVLILTTVGSHDAWYYPGIGDGQCWFYEGAATLLYFYIPMAALVVVNIILFIKTAMKIKQVQDDTSILRRDENKKHHHENEKQRFHLYIKLLLAMGINWSMEIISWAVDWQVEHVPAAVWYLTDLCNALYGVFIFFIFVFKRSIWNLLQKRYYMIIGKVHLARTITPTAPTPRSTETELSA
ncbi:hypothetical protein ILUMI_06612 [Ignelater luminosus]|uniref:G-protein coupled receptors family 2 profile 2 domain-containing protein n=1 Tax=Ignelater luminosus TaxID=2038154 RepID=A0A8K0GF68_IGNLU|nr:hypothetical protein ILUMI_06612 [Ignelater luminosus]